MAWQLALRTEPASRAALSCSNNQAPPLLPPCLLRLPGKRMLGMQERPSVKVLRYAADAAAAAASAAAQDRQMATPCGRRHSAYHRHLEVMRRQEQQQCVDAVLVRQHWQKGCSLRVSSGSPTYPPSHSLQAGCIARSAAAARKALMSGSGGVRGCLVWHTERQEGEEEEEAAEEADVAAGGSRLVQLKRKFGQQVQPGRVLCIPQASWTLVAGCPSCSTRSSTPP
jgi:hypothetical protein